MSKMLGCRGTITLSATRTISLKRLPCRPPGVSSTTWLVPLGGRAVMSGVTSQLVMRRATAGRKPSHNLPHAAVLAVPLARLLGLGAIIGYLAAGIAIGPWGLKLVTDPQAMLHFAEFGVVLMLFLVGLELEPRRLWACAGRSSAGAARRCWARRR
jgi:hypothetical protein